jgi:hypothetical protein
MSHRVDQVVAQLTASTVGGESKAKATVSPSTYAQVTSKTPEGVAIITINHPPVNSYNGAVHEALYRAYHSAANASDVRAIVITGTGKFFMAGKTIPSIFVYLALPSPYPCLLCLTLPFGYNKVLIFPVFRQQKRALKAPLVSSDLQLYFILSLSYHVMYLSSNVEM